MLFLKIASFQKEFLKKKQEKKNMMLLQVHNNIKLQIYIHHPYVSIEKDLMGNYQYCKSKIC